jgi:hypothetical protein
MLKFNNGNVKLWFDYVWLDLFALILYDGDVHIQRRLLDFLVNNFLQTNQKG